MAKMEAYSKKWYDSLAEGKMRGVKCKHCGKVMFPAYPVCDECSGTDLEWVEISGEGVVETFSYAPTLLPFKMEPVMIGWVRLDNGSTFASWLLDVDNTDEAALFERLPAPVKMEIIQVDPEENLYYPVFRLKDPVK